LSVWVDWVWVWVRAIAARQRDAIESFPTPPHFPGHGQRRMFRL
jgi:hypothetical protein